MSTQRMMREASIPRLLLQMSLPVILVMLVNVLYNMADVFFMGRTGQTMAVAAIALCGLAGTVCRAVLHLFLQLPLTLAAVVAAVFMMMILEKLKAYVPPAGALCILPMLIPAEAVPGYPIQILVGAALFMGSSLLLFRPERQSVPAEAPKADR